MSPNIFLGVPNAWFLVIFSTTLLGHFKHNTPKQHSHTNIIKTPPIYDLNDPKMTLYDMTHFSSTPKNAPKDYGHYWGHFLRGIFRGRFEARFF